MTNAEPSSPPPPPPAPKKRGCFFYGCITSLILLLVLAVGIVLGTRFLFSRLNQLVAQYTDTSPKPLPAVELPAEEMKALTERVTAFSQALDAHTNAAPLILTGPQVNALLATRPELAAFKGTIFVSFEGGQTQAQISLPLETLPKLPMVDTKGRYLNGSGTFKLAMSNGLLSVVLTSLEVKDKPAPPEFLGAFQSRNLAESANRGSNSAVFERIESVQVTNSTLVIQPKSN
jgi:hypothetical protein